MNSFTRYTPRVYVFVYVHIFLLCSCHSCDVVLRIAMARATGLYIGLHAAACQFFLADSLSLLLSSSVVFLPCKNFLCLITITALTWSEEERKPHVRICSKFLGSVRNMARRLNRKTKLRWPGGATDDIHRDEVLDLHDQLEQGELLEDSDSDVPERDARRNVLAVERANDGLNKDLLDLVASLQAKQADMAARMQADFGPTRA